MQVSVSIACQSARVRKTRLRSQKTIEIKVVGKSSCLLGNASQSEESFVSPTVKRTQLHSYKVTKLKVGGNPSLLSQSQLQNSLVSPNQSVNSESGISIGKSDSLSDNAWQSQLHGSLVSPTVSVESQSGTPVKKTQLSSQKTAKLKVALSTLFDADMSKGNTSICSSSQNAFSGSIPEYMSSPETNKTQIKRPKVEKN
ncbi:hypothetical protein Bhyg_02986 [Pseudolycoriella hygida]|uniref:Uncharacterized protein n=1 Tax=Pseudolycoriella hygida TaxID=35572 RepID=A0A9Q0NCG8_9DIPT|nr:hypothetical protein Bhyg_02986 [Pseudolycoriella hygida]